MAGIDDVQLCRYVIRPALQHLGLASIAAEQLVLGTAITESQNQWIKQLGSGPALGLWQMEPATHDDIWEHYLRYQRRLAGLVDLLRSQCCREDNALEALVGNLFYGAAMCRVHYRRRPEALPPAGDSTAMARYWKVHYNTPLGRGTVEKAEPAFQLAITQHGRV